MSTEAATPSTTAPSAPAHPVPPPRSWKLVAGVVVGLALRARAVPKLVRSLHTVSTDDAYVNSYVTFVAPRVAGQITRVLVEDNNRVAKGDVLVELDPEPYRVQVAIRQASLEAAQADLVAAQAGVRGAAAMARSQRFKLARAIEDVDNQIAILRARAANLEQAKASLTLAEAEFERARKLSASKVTSPEEFDRKREALDVARAQQVQALESVYQARVALGLPAQPANGASLTEVPADLDQNFSSVRQALAELLQSAAQLGIVPSSYNLTPKETIGEFMKRDAGGDIDKIYAEVIKDAPALKQAQAALQRAERDLDQAKLDLKYCTVVSEIDGVVTRRNANPGNHVQIGQSLMAVRSLREVWIDANFKETQVKDLRIGQKVELETDVYGSRHRFEGRISGVTMGTGSTLALLPAQNATGNFVKVVQRIPVRIDVVDYDPEKAPLIVGTSVEPRVDLKSRPTGPDAGQVLQAAKAHPAPQP
jgi:membrane fusion protein (multidrug efflux system)